MNRPTLDLQIEELILRNIPYAQRHHIATAIEQELTRLFSEQGVPSSIANGGIISRINIDNVLAPANAKVSVIGNTIAQTIYRNLSGDGSGNNKT
jgi:hypothetical protein